ncbi:MAG TPA: DMT family transporter [Bacteroidales bacterium]|nr:DMT family transporter [Bacteroidales bacterium]
MNTKTNTVILAITSCLLWATAYASIKIGLLYDTPFHFAGARFIISGLLILPFTVAPAIYIRQVRENWKVVSLVTLFQILVNYSFFYQGLNIVPGALGAVIVGSQPLVTAVIASIMNKNDKLTKNKLITIFSGIAGVIIISAGRQAFKLGTALELLGVFMLLIANAGVSVSNVIVSVRGHGINPFVLSSSTLFLGGVILYLVSIPVEGISNWNMPVDYWLSLAWLSFMAAAAFSIWYKLLQRPGVKVSELNLWKFIIPGIGAILSWLIVPGEKPDWFTVAGMIIITSSLVLFFRSNKPSPVQDDKFTV